MKAWYDVKSYDDVLEVIAESEMCQKYTMVAPPACQEDIEKLNIQITEAGMSLLPQDYIDFLCKLNGLDSTGWNNVFFYGSKSVTHTDPHNSTLES